MNRTSICSSLFTVIALLASAAALAEDVTGTPLPKPGKAGIASAQHLATDAGHEILSAGGNAFDAAVAVASTLAVVEPSSSGLGGGAFFLLHPADGRPDVMIDAREFAPAAVDAKMYLDADGKLDKNKAINGVTSAGIPGEPAGLVYLAEHYGRLPLAKSLAPAIRIAKEGFELESRLATFLGIRKEVLARSPEAANIFLRDGAPPKLGERIVQPDLAVTLEALAKGGHKGFYQGEVAKRLVDGVRAAGGNWTMDDLAAYQVEPRVPLRLSYRGYRLITAPPPSAGGVILAETLNVLEGYELPKLDRTTQIHLTVEAMRRAYRDRGSILGDPGFVKMPIALITGKDYAAGLRASIRLDQATPSSSLPGVDTPPVGNDTTHFSVIDRDGNLVAATLSVNLPMGSGFVVPGTGVVLNDEMDDFSLVAGVPNAYGLVGGDANAAQPHKRMLSTMTPTFVIGADRVAVLGTPGGSRIATMVLEGVLNFVDGKPVQEIVDAPRYHHQFLPDAISAEKGAIPSEMAAKLRSMGHTVSDSESTWGNMNALVWDLKANVIAGGADKRGVVGKAEVK